LPQDVQYAALRKIPGFGQARMFRPGYAIEYDYFPPTQLQASLETKLVEGLFFAGQINGTTGYEEAACQGLLAGANAHLKVNERQPLVLGRSQAYMGVLIDDLINKGTDEPYRMFTSRAEYRILLRQDNADIRLSEIALRHGMIGPQRYARVEQKMRNVEELTRFLRQMAAEPDEVNPVLLSYEEAPINQKVKLGSLLLRPGIGLQALAEASDELKAALASYPEEDKEQAEIQWKYQSYIEREEEQARKMANLDHIYLKPEFDYQSIRALSHEGREKLSTMRPASLGQASRLSGVSPADISILLVYLNKGVEWKQ
jgi:tRNA uridine 5-carboxymethylaminomethyl modification enzyme